MKAGRGKEQGASRRSAKEILRKARAQVASGGLETQGHRVFGVVKILAF